MIIVKIIMAKMIMIIVRIIIAQFVKIMIIMRITMILIIVRIMMADMIMMILRIMIIVRLRKMMAKIRLNWEAFEGFPPSHFILDSNEV